MHDILSNMMKSRVILSILCKMWIFPLSHIAMMDTLPKYYCIGKVSRIQDLVLFADSGIHWESWNIFLMDNVETTVHHPILCWNLRLLLKMSAGSLTKTPLYVICFFYLDVLGYSLFFIFSCFIITCFGIVLYGLNMIEHL